ncbi:MAG: hypothetical protein IT299_05420 [Dehalococcoidia bacterium]|nr:hypothetical protein [Dehalococcoidia bacterium]
MAHRAAGAAGVLVALTALLTSCAGGSAPAEDGAGAPAQSTASTSVAPAASGVSGASSGGAGTASASKASGRAAVLDDPCALLTLADVQTVMPDAQPGRIVGKEAASGACSWRNPTPLGPEVTYRYQRVEGAGAQLKAAMERDLKAPGAKRADVADAGTVTRATRTLSVGFVKGDIVVELLYIGDTLPTEESMIALAKAAAART